VGSPGKELTFTFETHPNNAKARIAGKIARARDAVFLIAMGMDSIKVSMGSETAFVEK
jgi:hypothetical protein